MKIFANREIRILFRTVLAVWAVALALTQGIVWYATHAFSFGLLLVFLLLGGCLWGVLFRYFQRQSVLLEQAVQSCIRVAIQTALDLLDCLFQKRALPLKIAEKNAPETAAQKQRNQ